MSSQSQGQDSFSSKMSQILTLFLNSISPNTDCVYVTLRNFRNMHKFLIFPSCRDQAPQSQLLSTWKKKKKIKQTEFSQKFKNHFAASKLKSLMSSPSQARETFSARRAKFLHFFSKVYIP